MKQLGSMLLFVLLHTTTQAHATQYLDVEQAQQLMFPGADAFIAMPVKLTPAQIDTVEAAAGVKMRFSEQPVWQVMQASAPVGWFVLDEVYGKHEFITYVLALDNNGAVMSLKILDYRETHGGEVRNENWLAQFSAKTAAMPLRLNEEIQYISGATLSSKHIVEGVRRILAIYDVALK